MSDPWLDKLRQLHDADKAQHEAKKPQMPEKPRPSRASEILRKNRNAKNGAINNQ